MRESGGERLDGALEPASAPPNPTGVGAMGKRGGRINGGVGAPAQGVTASGGVREP